MQYAGNSGKNGILYNRYGLPTDRGKADHHDTYWGGKSSKPSASFEALPIVYHVISKGIDRDSEASNFQPAATNDIVTRLDLDWESGRVLQKTGSRLQYHSAQMGFLFFSFFLFHSFFSQPESSHTHRSSPPHPVVARVAEVESTMEGSTTVELGLVPSTEVTQS